VTGRGSGLDEVGRAPAVTWGRLAALALLVARVWRSTVLAAALGLLLAGCGGTQTSGGGGGASPTRLSTDDAGRTVSVSRGTMVEVSLPAQAGFDPWSIPQSSDGAVVAPMSGGSRPASSAGGAPTTASFRAAGEGSARVSANARPACRSQPGHGCPALRRAWTVTITVKG
jgi:hypothetical protein